MVPHHAFFYYGMILILCLFLIPSVSASISLNPPIECPKELFRQKVVCKPGQALSSVTWDEGIPNCRHYGVTCKNATSSCHEHCEWNTKCQTNASVSIEMEYVRGIEIQYEYIEDIQTVTFLCCHSEDLKTGILDCDGKSSTELDGKSEPKLISIMSQAKSNDDSLSMRGDVLPSFEHPTCPQDKIQTNLEGSSFPVPGGTTGAGAGAGGLSLYIRCPSNLVKSGFGTYEKVPATEHFGIATFQACIDLCDSDPACISCDYKAARGQCNIDHSQSYTLIPIPGVYDAYIKACLTDAIPSFTGKFQCTC